MIRKNLLTAALLITISASTLTGCTFPGMSKDINETTEYSIIYQIDEAMENGEYDSAVDLCKQGIKEDSQEVEYYLSLSECYVKLDKIDKAKDTLNHGIESLKRNKDVERLKDALDKLSDNKSSDEPDVTTKEDKSDKDNDTIKENPDKDKTVDDEIISMIEDLPEDIITDDPNTSTPTANIAGLSSTYADKNNRSFAINGKVYTLGETTLQQLIDDGVKFEDTSNMNNNLKANYASENFDILLNDSEYYSCMIAVGNFTEDNKKIIECPITSLYMSVKADTKFVENTIEFAFPLTLTEAQLRANSGEPSDYSEYTSDNSDYYSHTLEYEWDNSKYFGKSGYSFEFQKGVFKYISMDYEP